MLAMYLNCCIPSPIAQTSQVQYILHSGSADAEAGPSKESVNIVVTL